MSEQKKFTNHKELTEEVLLAMPDQIARASAVMQVIPALMRQVEAGISELKGAFNVSHISESAESRKKLHQQSISLQTEAIRLGHLQQMIILAMNDLQTNTTQAIQKCYNRVITLTQAGLSFEVFDEHREDFYKAFVDFLTPFAEGGNKLAQLAIDPKEKKNVLKDGYQSLVRMVKIAKTIDGIPEWIPKVYGIGREFEKFIAPSAEEVELKLQAEQEEKKKTAEPEEKKA